MMEAKSPSKRLSSDIITALPQTIIEIILCFLPIKEAARTSILSRDWRYKWTTIPKLVFDCTTGFDIKSSKKNMDPHYKLFYAIHQVLLLRQAPIHEFTFDLQADCECGELDQIIFHLSRNHALKKLSLDFAWGEFYKLPLCAYSLHQLTELDLSFIDLDRQPIFEGFHSLRHLCFDSVVISTKALLHLLSKCPSLMSFTLSANESIGDKDCTINKLFQCLPVIENLEIMARYVIPMLVLDSVPKELPTSLIHLKCVCLNEMWLANDGLRLVLVLFKFSPNLETISLKLDPDHIYDNEIWSGILEEYSDVWLEHLNELIFICFRNRKPEMEFVKFILARSPKLKKVWIWGASKTFQEESEMLKVLLRAPRVSHVEIIAHSVVR